MRKMTKEFLESAFAGESMAHMKYLIFAEKADKEGLPNIARLFRAIAYAEQVHAANHYRVLGMVNDTAANSQVCIDGENYEVDEMYPSYKAVAEMQGETNAVRSFSYALEAEKIHAKMYEKVKESAEAGKDLVIGQIYICSVCGHTGEGEPPDVCPICKAKKDKFKTF